MKSKRILIADDKPDLRVRLRSSLLRLGFKVVGEAKTGSEAVLLNQKVMPDLIFMDVKMPELSGIEASRIITGSSRPAPVIMLTAKDDLKTILEAKAAGVMAYLVKPFNERELLPNIEIAVSRFKEFAALSDENVSLKETIETKREVEKAKGILMEKQHLTEDAAFRKIQKASMDTGVSMKEIAKSIIMADKI